MGRPPVRWPRGVFLSGQAVSLLGDGLAVLAVPLLVLDLTRNPLVSALSAASVTVGYLMVGLPAGVLVDRLDAWRVLLVTDALRAAAFAALFGFATAGLLTVWLVLALRSRPARARFSSRPRWWWSSRISSRRPGSSRRTPSSSWPASCR
jgi:MFS family permease